MTPDQWLAVDALMALGGLSLAGFIWIAWSMHGPPWKWWKR